MFTHLRNPIMMVKGVTKYLFMIILLSTVAGCSDKTDSDQAAPKGRASQDVAEQLGDEVASNLVEEGFYQEQTPTSSNESQRADEDIVESITNDDAEIPSPLNSEQTRESTTTNETETLLQNQESPIDSKSLVEDLGFSQAQQNQEPAIADKNQELFCLDNSIVNASPQPIKEACEKISNRLASVSFAACEAAKLRTTGCTSVKGFPILMTEFSPLEERQPQGRILIVGGTHGDELTSVSMIIRWIEKLNRHHSGLFHWHMVPMMNPDGVLKRGATRTNGNGVDLNRNMPSDDWELNALKYWVEKGGKDPRKYPGEAASSEPETQWLLDEIESFKPDAIISVHAPYGVVDFDSLVLNTAPKSLGKLHLNLLGTYPGSLGNYAGINLNIPVITLELPHSWVMPSEAESTKIWEDIVRWLKKNVNTEVVKN